MDGAELFDLIAALTWLREQPSHAPRADRLFSMIASSTLADRNTGRRLDTLVPEQEKGTSR